MKIIIAGSGCAKCKATEEVVRSVCAEAGLAAQIEHVYDIKEIARLGVFLTPAILIDGSLKMSGKAPTSQEVKKLLGIG
ncbi:MAG: thioredoxin family protein [Nitrospinota bacterium]|nr:thioredoxin family protein [Nitrospinota bacterium]